MLYFFNSDKSDFGHTWRLNLDDCSLHGDSPEGLTEGQSPRVWWPLKREPPWHQSCVCLPCVDPRPQEYTLKVNARLGRGLLNLHSWSGSELLTLQTSSLYNLMNCEFCGSNCYPIWPVAHKHFSHKNIGAKLSHDMAQYRGCTISPSSEEMLWKGLLHSPVWGI